ncbi:LOW QUALITY PROTEIN: origin recognition complex subunit 2 [Drosophila eugracilis]|uniref:LOW QUALITY PROTEIN: origin recognition complex subunit 2 n=1 Tax=Drosophila eugracilis TaxID=29029 RepID=UPI001BDB4259|nr:LOW QUALITY PROTEIN: origin recognition complex subunit 2 [Drosophila eugracilis]
MSASNKSGYKTPLKQNLKSIENITNSEEGSEDLDTAILEDTGESQSPVTRRRSTRRPSPTKKYQAYKDETNGKDQEERIVLNYVEMSDEMASETEDQEHEEEIIDESENADRPTSKDIHLLQSEYNVAGTSMFGFNTPKKRDGMAMAALKATPRTPKTPKTPRLGVKTPDTKRKKSTDQPKTPAHVRSRVKNHIAKMVVDSDADFSGDESDFQPSDGESSSSSNSSSDGGDSSDNDAADDEPKTPCPARRTIVVPVLPKTPSAARLRQSARAKKSNEFVPESDGYFHSHASSKILTSDHTLDRLKNPRLAADRVFSLLSEIKLSTEHEGSINAIMEEYRSYFPKWMCILNEGFNILLYGLGSKRQLLQSFHREVLEKQTVLVVNGFFPSLTLKDMLDSITSEILDAGISPANPHEAVDMIEEEFSLIPETHLFLIVHNLDGAMLRNIKAQAILSRLARVPNIHLLASIDHINTPLLWDQGKLSSFNFSWWDCTTMLPYTNETAFENSLLVQNSGELALSSMRSVFSSLTTNSRGIYMVIVKYQLKNKGNATYQGMPFKDLYSSCREAFLVSSDLALRAQLTEFLDHKLVKSKRNVDGSEQLTIPIDGGLLQQFLEEQEKK